jgi:CRP/FNR family transcriptional regulator
MISQWLNGHGHAPITSDAHHSIGANSHMSSLAIDCFASKTKRFREVGPASIANGLRHSRLFESLEWSRLMSIAALTTAKFLPKGKLLFLSGDLLHGFFIVQTGSVKLSRVNTEGKEQVIHVFRAGESFGEEALLSEQGYPADACALEDSTVLMVQKSGFVELLRRHPDLSLCILSATSRHMNDLMNLVADLRLLDVQTRLARWLVADCQQHGVQRGYWCVQLSMTKRVLAAELGTSSETLSRSLAKLSQQGLLAVHGQRIILLSLSKLTRLAEGNTEPCPPSVTRDAWRHTDLVLNRRSNGERNGSSSVCVS